MPHDTPLISTIVAGLVLAFIFGAIAHRFKMPPLVGYLVAGVLVGPHTPGFVADAELATELSEIGVILLMFGVGLHFSLKDLLSVRAIAIPGAIVQIAGATIMGVGLATLLGWSLGAGIIFGLALSVASTVVLLKALQDRHLVESERGRIAVGWLIVEDIAMVLALVLIPTLSTLMGGDAVALHDPFIDLVERLTGLELNIWGIIGVTVVKLAAFVGFMLVVGRRVIPWGLHMTAHTGSRELFRLAVLAIALGVAAGSAYLFGVSLALGAFFAGMILSESELSNRAAQETLPLRDAFAVLFFVSVGMLFDPTIILHSPLQVLATVFIILIGKSVLAFLIGVLFRQPVGTALTISASLAQIGEFSFILAALGVGLGILPTEGRDLILAGALISIVLNPVIFYFAESVRPRLEAKAASRHPPADAGKRLEPNLDTGAAVTASEAEERDERLPTTKTGHTILIGYGRVGTVVADGLQKRGLSLVLIEDSEKRVAAAHAAGIEVIVGNAATGQSLKLANVAAASALLIAIPNAFEAGQAVEQGRRLNPSLLIVARAHSDEEVSYLQGLGASEVIMGEREIGLGMLGWSTGEAARDMEAERTVASMAAVAAALKLDPAASRPSPPPAPAFLPVTESRPSDEPVAAGRTTTAAPAGTTLAPVSEPEIVVPPEVPRPSPSLKPAAAAPVASEPPVTTAAPVAAKGAKPKLDYFPSFPGTVPTEEAIEALEAQIEAAQTEHEPEGPAEPPELVPAFGEMPEEEPVGELSAEEQLRAAVAAEAPDPMDLAFISVPVTLTPPPVATTPAPMAEAEPEPADPKPVIPPKRPRALAPATGPGAPFKPDTE